MKEKILQTRTNLFLNGDIGGATQNLIVTLIDLVISGMNSTIPVLRENVLKAVEAVFAVFPQVILNMIIVVILVATLGIAIYNILLKPIFDKMTIDSWKKDNISNSATGLKDDFQTAKVKERAIKEKDSITKVFWGLLLLLVLMLNPTAVFVVLFAFIDLVAIFIVAVLTLVKAIAGLF